MKQGKSGGVISLSGVYECLLYGIYLFMRETAQYRGKGYLNLMVTFPGIIILFMPTLLAFLNRLAARFGGVFVAIAPLAGGKIVIDCWL